MAFHRILRGCTAKVASQLCRAGYKSSEVLTTDFSTAQKTC